MDDLPEKRLIGAIIGSALSEAKQSCYAEGFNAAEFLVSPRSDFYFNLLDIDPQVYRKRLWQWANTQKYGELASESKARRVLRNNLEKAMNLYGYQL